MHIQTETSDIMTPAELVWATGSNDWFTEDQKCTKIMFDLRIKHCSQLCTDQGIQSRFVTRRSQRETSPNEFPNQLSEFLLKNAVSAPTLCDGHVWDVLLSFQVDLICDAKCWSPQECRSPLKLAGVISQSQMQSKRLQFCHCAQTSRAALNLSACIGHLMAMAAMWHPESDVYERGNLKELWVRDLLGTVLPSIWRAVVSLFSCWSSHFW